MDYRGIITEGYYNDLGGQNTIRIISKGYVGSLSTVVIPEVITMTGVIWEQPSLDSALLSAPELTSVIAGKPGMAGITLN